MPPRSAFPKKEEKEIFDVFVVTTVATVNYHFKAHWAKILDVQFTPTFRLPYAITDADFTSGIITNPLIILG